MGKFISFIAVILFGIYLPQSVFSGTMVHVLHKDAILIKSELDIDPSKPGERRFEAILFENAAPITISISDIALLERLRSRIGNESPMTLLIDEDLRVFGLIENDDVFVPGSLFLSYNKQSMRSLDGESIPKPFQQKLIKLEKTKAIGFGKKIELEMGKWPVASVVTSIDGLKPQETSFQFGGLKILEKLFVASAKYQHDKIFVLNQMTSLYFSELNVDLYRLRHEGDDLVVAADYQIVFFSQEPRKVFVLATGVLDEADLEFQKPNL